MSEDRTFTQDEVNRLVGDARTKAREKAKADSVTQAAKDKEVADQATLVANQEWKKLADKHEARATELEPLVKQVEAYEEMTKEMLKEKIAALGDAAKTAVAGLPKSMTAVDKLNWLSKNVGLFSIEGNTGVGTPRSKSKPPVEAKDEGRRVKSL